MAVHRLDPRRAKRHQALLYRDFADAASKTHGTDTTVLTLRTE